jgi:GxxExxY protein
MATKTLERNQVVLDAARTVHQRLGKRCSVEQYEEELVGELRMRGIGVRDQRNTRIFMGGQNGGVYLADILIDGETLIEIKRAERLTEAEKERFGRFVEEIKYQRGYLMNFAGEDLEVATFPPSSR